MCAALNCDNCFSYFFRVKHLLPSRIRLSQVALDSTESREEGKKTLNSDFVECPVRRVCKMNQNSYFYL